MPVLRLLCLLLISTTCRTLCAQSEEMDPSRFEITVLGSGLNRPMELDIADNGTVYFIELDGKLRAYDPASRAISEVGQLTITTEQENGLIGLALDPDFAANQHVFIQYSPPDFPGQHISRFTLVDGQLDLASEKLLLKFEEQRKECCHHAGSLHFGPDGNLFIATGDNTHPHADSQGYAPLDERPDRAPWDAQKSSGNTDSYSGKILRIHPTPEGGYTIPEGNLFPPDGSHGRPEIYAMGCRNPWRMNVDQETGFVYWGEVGPDAGGDGPRGPRGYDEINQARQAGNFGWPYFIANNLPYANYDYETQQVGPLYDLSGPTNDSPNNTGERVLPPPTPALIYYPYGASTDFPELGEGGRTACAGPVYHFNEQLNSPTRFPAAFDKCLIIFEWTRHWIKVVHLTAAGDVASIEPFMANHKFVRPIDMEFGPDGALYVIEYGETWGVNPEARLIRIDYVRGNRPPVVAASATNNFGREPLAVTLSSEGTFDKDRDDVLKYEWRLIDTLRPDAAPVVLSQDANVTVSLQTPGVFNAELTVTDSAGLSRSAAVPVVVGNDRPAIAFIEPQEGDFYDDQGPIAYRLRVSDPEDGTNDEEQVDNSLAELLDADAPNRVTLNASFTAGLLGGGTAGPVEGPPGLMRMKSSDCFNCHAVDQKRVGPPLLEVALKYRGKEGALEASVQRVMKGSTGVWGKIPMIPHSHNTPEEIHEMVSWIYSLEPVGLTRVFNGFVGSVPVNPDEVTKPGYYTLEASYLDLGALPIPPLSGSATVHLRQRTVEAELADEVHGPQILGAGNAGGGKFCGAINDGHYLKFANILMNDVGRISARVSSAGQGGQIEIRLDAPDGELLETLDIENNGDWTAWYDRATEILPTAGRHDVFIVFTHPSHAGGLMNLDSIRFDRPQPVSQ